MDTKHIYEELMLGYYFNKMKHLRDHWDNSPEERFPGVASLIDVGGKEHRLLSMEQSRNLEGGIRIMAVPKFFEFFEPSQFNTAED